MNAIRLGVSAGRWVAVRAPASSRADRVRRTRRAAEHDADAGAEQPPGARDDERRLVGVLGGDEHGDRPERGRDGGDE